MITESPGSVGQFSITFAETLPRSLRRILANQWCHVYVLATRLRPTPDLATLRALSRYTGVVLSNPTPWTAEGAGLGYWLGDSNPGANTFYGSGVTEAKSLSAWATALQANLAVGNVESIGSPATSSHTFDRAVPADALDEVCRVYGAEWRVNHDGTLDVGTVDYLYGSTPNLVITRDGGHDLRWRSMQATTLSSERDGTDYATGVVVERNGGWTSAQVSTVYNRWEGVTGHRRRRLSANVDSASAAAWAATEAARWSTFRYVREVTTTRRFPTRAAAPGSRVYVYDPRQGLVDMANEVTYRGTTIHPLELRVAEVVWPVPLGAGVYLADSLTSDLFDVSDHLRFEGSSTATIRLGATRRRLTNEGVRIA